uniref:Uncharacterized protein n=1 Tax=Rhizophora mucronata TaxID=61149 RepID=A0A2P2PVC3_RHIMU
MMGQLTISGSFYVSGKVSCDFFVLKCVVVNLELYCPCGLAYGNL